MHTDLDHHHQITIAAYSLQVKTSNVMQKLAVLVGADLLVHPPAAMQDTSALDVNSWSWTRPKCVEVNLMTKLVRQTSSERHWTVAAPRHNPFQPEFEASAIPKKILTLKSSPLESLWKYLGTLPY